MLAIHDSQSGFHPRWIGYCDREGIPYRLVNCHASDIIEQVIGCQALMWHHSQSEPRDILIAEKVLFALEHSGVKVFPNFRTSWHFDDKVAQKYLFEALDIPAVPAHVFVDRDSALDWIEGTAFPKVFKLRRGAGSAGVRLVTTRSEARKLVNQAFSRGFPLYDPWGNLKERIYKYRSGSQGLGSLGKGVARFIYPPRYSHTLGRERGYVYFQDYLPGNDCDIRIIVVGDRAFGIKRMVRPGDFRASGSGRIRYAREDLDERCVELAFLVTDRMGCDSAALDFVYDRKKQPAIIEVSYGFSVEGYDPCSGHWDRRMNWHSGPFNPQAWMVERLLDSLT